MLLFPRRLYINTCTVSSYSVFLYLTVMVRRFSIGYSTTSLGCSWDVIHKPRCRDSRHAIVTVCVSTDCGDTPCVRLVFVYLTPCSIRRRTGLVYSLPCRCQSTNQVHLDLGIKKWPQILDFATLALVLYANFPIFFRVLC